MYNSWPPWWCAGIWWHCESKLWSLVWGQPPPSHSWFYPACTCMSLPSYILCPQGWGVSTLGMVCLCWRDHGRLCCTVSGSKLEVVWSGNPGVATQKLHFFNMPCFPFFPFYSNWSPPVPWVTHFPLPCISTPLSIKSLGWLGSGLHQIILGTKLWVYWPQRWNFNQTEDNT